MKMPLRYLHRSSGKMQLSMDANSFDLLNHDWFKLNNNENCNKIEDNKSCYNLNNTNFKSNGQMRNKLQRSDSNYPKLSNKLTSLSMKNEENTFENHNKECDKLLKCKSKNNGQAQLNELNYCSMSNYNSNSNNRSDFVVNNNCLIHDNCESNKLSKCANYQRKLMRCQSWKILLAIFIGCLSIYTATACELIPKSPGRTWPVGDIVTEVGKPLRILCLLNKTKLDLLYPNKNASSLYFYKNNVKVDSEYVKILNETTIELYIEHPEASENVYHCNLKIEEKYRKTTAICLNKVAIGEKPQKPQNFTCTSYNWDELICKWDPKPNFVKTKFTVTYQFVGQNADHRLYNCPPPKIEKNLPPNSCYLGLVTDPIYRQLYEYYVFNVHGENVFGSANFRYPFHHFANVIPSNPVNLTVSQRTSESALLSWFIPYQMKNFPRGLYHQIRYKCQYSQDRNSTSWTKINITDNVSSYKKTFNLTGLQYAYAIYDVRVFIKSSVATGEDKWGNFSAVTFRTLPKLPGKPPRTDIGSFDVIDEADSRKVTLYWQTIPVYYENGDNFRYTITKIEENGHIVSITPTNLTRTYAIFKLSSSNDYRFDIQTSNSVGLNPNKATIFVPKQSTMPAQPTEFTKMEYNGLLYGLSWAPPKSDQNISNYTIFWCNNDHLSECKGHLSWTHIPKNYSTYNITVPDSKTYQFAIAANHINGGSSGMIWARCTISDNKIISRMSTVSIETKTSDSITVTWKLDCAERHVNIIRFKIYYCPTVSPHNLTCRTDEKVENIIFNPANKSNDRGIIKSLIPYTTYKIAVSVETLYGEGKPSNPLLGTTMDAPPTVPLNIRASNITNSSIQVSWDPPKSANGKLMFYEIFYYYVETSINSKSIEGKSKEDLMKPQTILLDNLLPYKNYSIQLRVCNPKCSEKTKPLIVSTLIGLPGKIIKTPTVRFVNSTQVYLAWSKPNYTGGKLDYYQISSSSSPNHLINESSLETKLTIPHCNSTYRFKIRAVNINSNNQTFYGPWSESGEVNCYNNILPHHIYIVIWIIGTLSGIAFIFCIAYTFKRMWFKCKAMQDVEVKLPPGLAREKLLQKVNEQHIRQLSADSSGCSSGQESVTSSLTSESHISTDSGTEADSISPNKLLEPTGNSNNNSSSNWETSSLRQRNVATTKITPLNDPIKWDSRIKISQSTDSNIYEGLSLDKSTPNLADNAKFIMPSQTWSSTGYISMPSTEELSKTPNSSSQIGCYSIVGVNSNKKNEPKELLNDIMFNYTDTVPNVPPYVSLASVEQATKQKPLTMFNKPTKPCILDQSSKSYVQTGLIDNLLDEKSSFVPTCDSNLNKPNSNKCIPMYADTLSKPYVTVASIQSDDKQKHQKNQDNRPYVQASNVLQMFQEPNINVKDNLCTEDNNDKDKLASKNYPNYWETDESKFKTTIDLDDTSSVDSNQKSLDHVSSLKETLTPDKQINKKITSPYVQHDQLEKQLLPSTNPSSTDEQYSKVAVAPKQLIK